MTIRERIALLLTASVLIVEHRGLPDLITCLHCIVDNNQCIPVHKLVFCDISFKLDELHQVLELMKVREKVLTIGWGVFLTSSLWLMMRQLILISPPEPFIRYALPFALSALWIPK